MNSSHTLTSLERPSDTQQVRAMFDGIAPRYDLLNALLSGGMHRVWEKQLVSSIPANSDGVCLDLCTGTGALVPRLAKRFRAVIGIDISPGMLERARERWSMIQNVSWQLGDAQHLESAAESFDAVFIAYGVRNWPDRESGLREVTRVLKRGGYLSILEFGQPSNPIWRRLFGLYSKYIIPTVGGVVSGSRQAYEYLPKTSAMFPCGPLFEQELYAVGLTVKHTQPLMGGIAFIYTAQKV